MRTTQPILDELHSIREQLLADSGGTLEGLVARIQKEQEVSGRIIRKTRQTKIGIEVRPAAAPLPHHPASESAPGGTFPGSELLPED